MLDRAYWYGRSAVAPAPPSETYESVILADSPSGFWRLSGAGPEADLSGNGNALTYNGSPTTEAGPCADGSLAHVFNGTDQSASAAHAAAFDFGTGDYSIEFWIKLAAYTSGRYILGHSGNGDDGAWEVSMTSSAFTSRVGDTGVPATADGPAADSAWHHCVLTMDRDGNGTWYHDASVASGSPDSISAAAAESVSRTTTLWIARRESTAFMPGSLANVAIYPSLLSPERVTAHYAARLLS